MVWDDITETDTKYLYLATNNKQISHNNDAYLNMTGT